MVNIVSRVLYNYYHVTLVFTAAAREKQFHEVEGHSFSRCLRVQGAH